MKYHGMRGRYRLVYGLALLLRKTSAVYGDTRAGGWVAGDGRGVTLRSVDPEAYHVQTRPDKNMFNTTAAYRETQTCGQFTSDMTSKLGADRPIG
jgi:hypothetical protein